MDFDRLIRHSDYSGQKELVGLAIFHSEEYTDKKEVARTTIVENLQTSRVSVPEKNISTYLSRLTDDGLLTTGEDGYRLTHDGQEFFKELVDSDLVEEPREDLFIDSDAVDEKFYERLVEDINECYRVRVNDAVLVLTRKLFENLLVDILRGHYGRENFQLFFDTNRGYHYGLSELKRNLRENVGEFRIYSRDIDEDLLDDLDEFKERGDAGAHSIVVDVDDKTVENMSQDATQLFEVLYDVWQGVRIANESGE